jgi:beta-lactam-binding protein with PASTA domain
MALTARVWGAGKTLVIAGALAATYLLFFFLSMRLALRTREVTVPDVRNRSVNEASAAVTDEGLTLKVEAQRRLDAKVAAGRIVAQDPEGGSRMRSQRTVKVWLSDGATASIVPALIGESERTAQLRAQAAGVDIAAISEVRSGDFATGAVVAQSPSASTRANRVALLVNRGAAGRSYVMPDLVGTDAERAADILRQRGFRVSIVGTQPYPGVPAGIVLRQQPQGGYQVGSGDPISLEVTR